MKSRDVLYQPFPNSRFQLLILVFLVALLSFLTGKVGEALVIRVQMLWPVWPGCALLVAFLLLLPERRVWPALIAAGVAGFAFYELQAGLTLHSIVLLALGDTIEILIAALGLHFAFDGTPSINNLKSLAKYSLFAVLLAPLAGSSIAAAAFAGNYWIRWRIGFFTEALAFLSITPAIWSWVSIAQTTIRKSRAFYFEGATVIAWLTFLGYIAFLAPGRSSLPALLYSLLPLLLWSALRFGMMGVSTAMIVVAFLSIWGAVHGRGPFISGDPLDNVMSSQLFLFVVSGTFLVFAVLVEGHAQDEETLRDNQQRLTGMIASAMDSIISVDDQRRVVLFNAAAEKMFRCSAAEAMGAMIDRFVPERFRSSHVAHIRQFGETGVTNSAMETSGALRALRADGEEFEIEACISQNEARGKKVYTIILRDITERKQAEQALRKSEEKFSKVFRSSPLAVTISTAVEGRYLDVNQAFLQMVGHHRRDVIGRTSLELHFWTQASRRQEMLRQLAENARVTGFRTQFTTSRGEIREAEVSAELVELDGQNCLLAISRDITETQLLEAQLLQAQKMEAVGRVAGGIAHDFNNLLGVIIGYSDLSRKLLEPESLLNRHLEQIKRASTRAVSLTRQLLAFSRQQVTFPKVLDLNELVRSATGMLQRIAGEDVRISFRPILPVGSIQADPHQIDQVLMNLVVNARDAISGRGTIVIETDHSDLDEHFVSKHSGARTGQHVVLTVSDTGCGMDEFTKSKIFEPFFTTKDVGEGTGLGLSTVYGIVKQNGGYIVVDSALGLGTIFKIYFPRVAARAGQLVDRCEEAEILGGSETVLVVEDDDLFRELVVGLLQDAGYRVIGANRAKTALDTVRAADPKIDLLLTDVMMPEESGVELLEQARAVEPDLRYLFMSGYSDELVRQHAGSMAEATFLEKPFTRGSLLKKVHTALQVKPEKPQPQAGRIARTGTL